MPACTQCLYHVVFGTKHRRSTLNPSRREDFLRYCCGIITGMQAHTYRINCVEDHMHILVGLPSTLDVAAFVRRFKVSTGNWLRTQDDFRAFDHWQKKYGAFTVSWASKATLIEYITNQQEHHRTESYLDEFKRLLRESGLQWNPLDDD